MALFVLAETGEARGSNQSGWGSPQRPQRPPTPPTPRHSDSDAGDRSRRNISTAHNQIYNAIYRTITIINNQKVLCKSTRITCLIMKMEPIYAYSTFIFCPNNLNNDFIYARKERKWLCLFWSKNSISIFSPAVALFNGRLHFYRKDCWNLFPNCLQNIITRAVDRLEFILNYQVSP